MPYKIQKGDTLSELAQKFNVPMSELADINQIKDVDKIYYDRMLNIPGQEVIPPGGARTFPMKGYDPRQIRGEHFVEGEDDIKAYTRTKPTFSEIGERISNWWDRNDEIHKEIGIEQSGGPGPLQYPTGELGGNISDWWDRNSVRKSREREVVQPIEIEQSGGLRPSTKPTLGEVWESAKPTLTRVLNEDVGRLFNKLDEWDENVKSGDFNYNVGSLIKSFSDKVKKGAEGFAEDASALKIDFVSTLSDWADDNNLDMQSAVELIDIDWLYELTGVRNKKQERKALIEAHRRQQEQQVTVGRIGDKSRGDFVNSYSAAFPGSPFGVLPKADSGSYAQGGLTEQVRNVAAQGRYGDSMLMHVNPAEVRGLAQVAPITINPQTGQPEAFLPFLAPLLGSMLGGSLLGGTALGGVLGTLGSSALGSGIAQWAATGDIKKGLIAGLTGYGIGSALQGAAGAAGASAAGDAATTAATQAGTAGQAATQEVIQSAATQGGSEALTAASTYAPATATAGATGTPWSNLKSVFNPAAISETTASAAPDLLAAGTQAAPSFGTSMGNLAAGFSQPGAIAGIAGGMAPTAVMESQEQFARQMQQMEADESERKRLMWENTPEPTLYSAQGGPTNIDESLMMDASLLGSSMNAGGRVGFNGGADTGWGGGGGGGHGIPGAGNSGSGPFSGDKQRFTPARQTYDVNPAFMAGFQPETMYFQPNTINQPASATTTGVPPALVDDYTGSKGGYGMVGIEEAPLQTIDPYAAYTGPAPQGLVEKSPFSSGPGFKSGSGFRPDDPEMFVSDPTPTEVFAPDLTPAPIPGGDSLSSGTHPGMDSGMPDYMYDDEDGFEFDGAPFDPFAFGLDAFDPVAGAVNNWDSLTGTAPPMQPPMAPPIMQPPPMAPPIMQPPPMAPPIMQPPVMQPPIAPPVMQPPVAPPVMQPPVAPPVMYPPVAPPVMYPPVIPPTGSGGGHGGGYGGGKRGGRAAGGETGNIMQDPITQEVVLFITGESDNQQAVNDFVTKYGAETFSQLRDYVLKALTNEGVQTEGQIEGVGNSGMADDIPGMIGANEKIAVSQDEFIVPADVVSALGDGSSNAGSNELYAMMDRVRQEKTGTTRQAPKLANAGGLLPR